MFTNTQKQQNTLKSRLIFKKDTNFTGEGVYNNNSQKIVQKTIQKINLIFLQLLKSCNDEKKRNFLENNLRAKSVKKINKTEGSQFLSLKTYIFYYQKTISSIQTLFSQLLHVKKCICQISFLPTNSAQSTFRLERSGLFAKGKPL